MIQRRAKFQIKPTISAKVSSNNYISTTPIQSPIKSEPITEKNEPLKEILFENNSHISNFNQYQEGNEDITPTLISENNNLIQKEKEITSCITNTQRRLPIKPKVQSKVLKKVTFQNTEKEVPNNTQVILGEDISFEHIDNDKSSKIQDSINDIMCKTQVSVISLDLEENLNQKLEKDLLKNQEKIKKNKIQVNECIKPNNELANVPIRQPSQSQEPEQNNGLNQLLNNNLEVKKSEKIIDKIITRKSKPRQKSRITEIVNHPIDPSKVSMADMIYLNPAANPMKQDSKSNTSKKIEKIQEDLKNDEISEKEDDEPEVIPQVRIGPDGNIVLNEASMIIEEKPKKAPKLELVDETHVYRSGYSRKGRTKIWSVEETKRFYAALSMIGTDFSFMCRLFPNRKRVDLKKKFKREEKHNRFLIEAALRERKPLDIYLLSEIVPEEENKSTKKDLKKIQLEELEPILSPPIIVSQEVEKKKRLKRKHYFYDVSDDEYEPPQNSSKFVDFGNPTNSNLLPLTRRISKKKKVPTATRR